MVHSGSGKVSPSTNADTNAHTRAPPRFHRFWASWRPTVKLPTLHPVRRASFVPPTTLLLFKQRGGKFRKRLKSQQREEKREKRRMKEKKAKKKKKENMENLKNKEKTWKKKKKGKERKGGQEGKKGKQVKKERKEKKDEKAKKVKRVKTHKLEKRVRLNSDNDENNCSIFLASTNAKIVTHSEKEHQYFANGDGCKCWFLQKPFL